MAEAPLVQRIPAIINGISRQSPTLRHPSQCEDAENVTFSVIDGFMKRSGTEFVLKHDGGQRTQKYKMHRIERDETREFAVIYGHGVFAIANLVDGTVLTPDSLGFDVTEEALLYLNDNSPTSEDLRLITVADSTFVLNTKVAPQAIGLENEEIDGGTMPLLLVRNNDETWSLGVSTWNKRPYYQQILKSPDPEMTQGDFKLRYLEQETSLISFDADAEFIEEALEELIGIGDGKIQAIGGPINRHDVVINFSPDLTVAELIQVVSNTTEPGAGPNITHGSDVTNPVPKIISEGLYINDIGYHRGRLVLGGDEFLVFSGVDDLFNYYAEDANLVLDSDPFEVTLSANDVTIVDYIVPHRDTLLIMTKAGQQFQLSAGDILSPMTAAVTPSTRYETQSVRPVTMGDNLFFVGQHRKYSMVYQYIYDDSTVNYRANDVTKHIFDFIPTATTTMLASPNNDTLVVIPRNDINESAGSYTSAATGDWDASATWVEAGSPQPYDDATIASGHTVTFDGYADATDQDMSEAPSSDLFVYRQYLRGNEMVQSAWGRWTFGATTTADNIMDAIVIDNDMYILVRSDLQGTSEETTSFFIWKVTLTDERVAEDNYDYDVLLDHRHTISSTVITTTGGGPWTHTFYIKDGSDHIFDHTLDTIVLSKGWAASGSVLKKADADFTISQDSTGDGSTKVSFSNSVESPGDLIIGRGYDGSVTLSTVFMRNDNSPISEGRTILQKVILDHADAGPYDIVVADTGDAGRADRTFSFTPTGNSEEFGTHTAWVHGRGRDTSVTVKISEPKPCTISAVEYHGQYSSLLEA